MKVLKMIFAEQYLSGLLEKVGISIDGTEPWDIRVNKPSFFNRVMYTGTLGAGESYMDGEWDCDAIDEMCTRLFRASIFDYSFTKGIPSLVLFLKTISSNMSNHSRAFQIGKRHYDIGNDLYKKMLDKQLIYSCGYWKNADNLDKAQENKLDLICRKLQLKPGMCVLDIGGGWGGFSRYAAENYHAHVVNISVSKEQIAFAEKHKKNLPIENLLQDYRDTTGVYDRIVSVGMFEHVGYKNYDRFMRFAVEHLNPDGLFLLHTIGSSKTRYINDPWIERYIFPNSLLPSIKQISKAAEKYFIVEDWHNFGADYDKTLMMWHRNFEESWPSLAPKYGEKFYRMWRFYLLTSAACFRSRRNQLWQIVLSPKGVLGGYDSIR